MGFMDELKKLAKPYPEDDEDIGDGDYDYDPDDAPAPSRSSRSARSSAAPAYNLDDLGIGQSAPAAPDRRGGGGKVVNIHAATQLQVILVKPDRFDSVSEIADHLREKHAVVLNLEQTSKDVARRLVDFLSGCTYALDGKIKKVAASTYVITPYNVDFVGDLVDELENNGMYL